MAMMPQGMCRSSGVVHALNISLGVLWSSWRAALVLNSGQGR